MCIRDRVEIVPFPITADFPHRHPPCEMCIRDRKKKALIPQTIQLPAPVKRTVGVTANFLCDNSSYILGADKKGKPQRSLECFQACKTRCV